MIRPSAVANLPDRSSNRSFYGDNGEHRAPSVDRGVQVSSVVFLFHIGERAVASALSDIKSPSFAAGKDYTQQLHGYHRVPAFNHIRRGGSPCTPTVRNRLISLHPYSLREIRYV